MINLPQPVDLDSDGNPLYADPIGGQPITALQYQRIRKTMDYVKRNPTPRRANRIKGRRSTDGE